MAMDPYTFVVAASAAISGGLFSGGLHAIAGTCVYILGVYIYIGCV
jgi:hypothetical protein